MRVVRQSCRGVLVAVVTAATLAIGCGARRDVLTFSGGMLYWPTDRMPAAPDTFAALDAIAHRAIASKSTDSGFVWQGARYEGLVTVFLEYLVGYGGAILDPHGRVVVDSPAAVRALAA